VILTASKRHERIPENLLVCLLLGGKQYDFNHLGNRVVLFLRGAIMQNRTLVKGRTTYTLIGIITFAVISAMVCSYFMSERVVSQYVPLVDAAMEIKLEATTAHLWLEELVSGDKTEKIEVIVGHIDQSLWYASAMLKGGTNSEGTYLPLRDSILRSGVESVISDLHSFKSLTVERYELNEELVVGPNMDQNYDRAFGLLINKADQVETLLQQKIRTENHIYKAIQLSLIVIIFMSSCLVCFLQVKYAHENKKCMMALNKEIEERKTAEEKLSESNALKDEFIATASHELCTPLAVLSGYSELLLGNDRLSDEVEKECLQAINSKAHAMDRIVDELLDVSRLDSGREVQIDCASVKIVEVARIAVQQFEAKKHPCHFTLSFDDEQLELDADSGKVLQVFENLIGNAIKYSPDGGEIVLKGEQLVGQYRISVADAGMGMSTKQQGHVFEKYYRANPSSTKGLGIGLYLVKNIIESHKGETWFESDLGKGTTFFFTLPLSNGVS
jgi:signal transduction histidine kinase